MRIAVVGSGISGLAAALRLAPQHAVTLFEADTRLGGHTNTVDVTLDGVTHPVDTGFLVLNERTYPNLLALFRELDVPIAKSDMSFSASIGPHRLEWCGASLGTVFAQPSNLLRPRFLGMLRDILRFNRQATALARELERLHPGDGAAAGHALNQPLGQWLDEHGYGAGFRDWYLLPMAAAIWSCPMSTMVGFPLGAFVRFWHNHGLLQVEGRPQWFTVDGGARRYVDRIASQLADVRTATPVREVRRVPGPAGTRIALATDRGTEHFDHVVLATHSSQTLAMLADAGDDEREALSGIPYQPNVAWLHTDTALMPRRQRAWAAWNYMSNGDPGQPRVSLTYWLNRLQPLPFRTPVLVSLNPMHEPAPDTVIERIEYAHPVFDGRAPSAQRAIRRLQGARHTWFAGAWTGYGFHEDGLKSGLAAAAGILEATARAPRLDRAAA